MSNLLLTSPQVKIPAWSATQPPIYNPDLSYLDNAEKGPFFEGIIPPRHWTSKDQWSDFLGFKVASRIGIPAGPLLNSKWIGLAGELGFDIVCYKTIRSHAHPGHGQPNIVYIESSEQLNPSRLPEAIQTRNYPPDNIENLAITNSFGMPSRSHTYLKEDILAANQRLKNGQVMVVSIVGSSEKGNTQEAFVKDFVEAASLAKEYGAKIIEANFSCPNVTTGEGCIYYNPQAVYEIASEIIKTIQNTPLIIKLGVFANPNLMKECLIAAAKAGVQAVSGINTLSLKVINEKGAPALGVGRLTSGVCGGPIREAALAFIQQARKIIDEEKLNLTLIGVGGIVLPHHFRDFFNCGADIAMTATGMMWDPYLAARYHNQG